MCARARTKYTHVHCTHEYKAVFDDVFTKIDYECLFLTVCVCVFGRRWITLAYEKLVIQNVFHEHKWKFCMADGISPSPIAVAIAIVIAIAITINGINNNYLSCVDDANNFVY